MATIKYADAATAAGMITNQEEQTEVGAARGTKKLWLVKNAKWRL